MKLQTVIYPELKWIRTLFWLCIKEKLLVHKIHSVLDVFVTRNHGRGLHHLQSPFGTPLPCGCLRIKPISVNYLIHPNLLNIRSEISKQSLKDNILDGIHLYFFRKVIDINILLKANHMYRAFSRWTNC